VNPARLSDGSTPGWVPTGLGFGGSAVGNLSTAISDRQAGDAIERAWALGVRYFDTAPHYGFGLSERRIGTALAAVPRDELLVSTKVGRLIVPRLPPAAIDDEGFAVAGDLTRAWDFSREGVARSLRESCVRLGLDRVDIALVHDPDRAWDGAARDGLRALAELRADGEVRAVGIGTTSTSGLAELIEDRIVDLVLLAGRYTLLDHRAGLPVLTAAERHGVAVVLAGVFNSGVLATPRPRVGARYEYRDADPAIVAVANRMADVCESHGVDLPTAAIAFARRHPSVTAVVVGMGSATEVDENVARFATSVPGALWDDLAARSLIDERCAAP
jgi:D-threo-aldose 1-dehydrogenase